MNAITGRLGLDTKPLTSDLNRAASEVNAAGRKMSQGFGGAAAGSENLLRSNVKVARQIQNFSRDLASGADATQLFSDGLMGLEKALKLPLGALAGLGVAALVFQKIHEAAGEASKLHAEIVKITAEGNSNPQFTTLDALTKKLEQLKNTQKDLAKGGGFWANLASYFKAGSFDLVGNHVDSKAQSTADRLALKKQEVRDNREIAGKVGEEADLAAIKDPTQREAQKLLNADLQRRATLTNANSESDLGRQLTRLLNNAFEELAHTISEKRKDRAQLSLADLAENGSEWSTNVATNNGMGGYHYGAGHYARQALQEQALARQSALNDDLEGSHAHLQKADEIKNGISVLKDSEKDLKGEFKGALDESAVLKEIRDKVSFKGQ